MRTKLLVVGVLCMCTMISRGQEKINLAKALKKNQIEAVNRTILLFEKTHGGIEMNAADGSGLGILKEVKFETGTIEVELLGENNPGKSFIGIAFNIQDEETYEAVYFRPFNFVATEQERKEHMVQYIHHPTNTWFKLREERTGEFENEISLPPDPDRWFRVKIVVSETRVQVYIKGVPEAVLQVDRLAGSGSQKIGLWTGHGSSGRYRNLVVTSE